MAPAPEGAAPPENEELARSRAELAVAGCDVALLASVTNVTYVSGFEVPLPTGVAASVAFAAPFAVLSVTDPATWLATSVFHTTQAKRESRLDHLLTFAGFDSFTETDARGTYLEAVRSALRQAGLTQTGRLGVEGRALPYGAAAVIAREFPNVQIVEIDEALDRARRIKTPREIARLRRAAHIGDIGHQTLAELAPTAGRNEFDMYAEIIKRMQQAVGHEITVSGELVTGPRTTTVNYPDGPRDRLTLPGEPALMDISQRVDGYWSDCTNTHIIGSVAPSALQKKLARASQAAFEAARENLRPGQRASEVWAAAHAAYEKCGVPMPHYMGHQIGATVNELPRLVPYDHSPIEANMVFAVEPGAYEGPGGTFGARSEKMILVTEGGPEVLSQFEWGI
jgi:Xaa-Pro aminopeptidase